MPKLSPAHSFEVTWGPDSLRVTNIPAELPADSTEPQIQSIDAAGKSRTDTWQPEEVWKALGRGSVEPDKTAHTLTSDETAHADLLTPEHVEAATLRTLTTRVLLSELFPGPQPRTAVDAAEVPDPQICGVAHEGRPVALLRYQYDNLKHLRDHVWHTLHTTLSRNSYAASILTRSVSRPLVTHPVEITFGDGTESLHILVVRDGITRLASAWSVLAGHTADSGAVATLATNALFGGTGIPSHSAGLGQRLAEARTRWRQQLRTEFREEIAGTPTLRAAQIAQSYAVPAQITLGVEGHLGHTLPTEDIFDDAMRSVLASIHVEFKEWDAPAQNIEVITRALTRVIQQDDPRWNTAELQDVHHLALGRVQSADLPQVFGGENPPPGTDLWRAVYLISAMTKPDLLELLKDQAKAIKGGQRMSMKGFGELLAPIIDLPWRQPKSHVLKQARNAWANGGVLSGDVTKSWTPRPTSDFAELVAPAMNGDDDARCTLAVAGGVALIADKLLTRNVGSSLGRPKEKGGVPLRLDVHKAIEGLSRPDNELGLWTLALAANAFRSSGLPQNSVTRQSLTGAAPAQADESPYVYFKADLAAKDHLARNTDGVPVRLYEWDVVAAAYPERMPSAPIAQPAGPPLLEPTTESGVGSTRAQVSQGSSEVAHPEPFLLPAQNAGGLPPSQRAAALRKDLHLRVQGARDILDHLYALVPEVSEHTPVVPEPQLDELRGLLIGIMTDVENLRRKSTEAREPDDDEEPDGEEGMTLA
ncbi:MULTISPECIES: hypothetical protein [unclassified Streptomyces]|uniref:hypothetical protein n=1 Tax=unclassified Streptomyces TaxID=2593676 RepID=UPI003451CC5F